MSRSLEKVTEAGWFSIEGNVGGRISVRRDDVHVLRDTADVLGVLDRVLDELGRLGVEPLRFARLQARLTYMRADVEEVGRWVQGQLADRFVKELNRASGRSEQRERRAFFRHNKGR